MLAYIHPISGSGGEIDNTLPGSPNRPDNSLPITLPPLPGIWPKPGEPSLPIVIPPGRPINIPTQPIYIPGSPELPIAIPPGTIWPPLPPDAGLGGSGTVAILIWVVGVGSRWLILDTDAEVDNTLPGGKPPVAGQPLPPHPEPKGDRR